jgi:hypothetical protein
VAIISSGITRESQTKALLAKYAKFILSGPPSIVVSATFLRSAFRSDVEFVSAGKLELVQGGESHELS